MAKLDMRTGSTTIMILRLLADQPMYGYQMVKELQTRSDGYFDLEQGTLYPALHRLEREGFVRSEWQVVEDGPSRKYYHITEEGNSFLNDLMETWNELNHAVNQSTKKLESK